MKLGAKTTGTILHCRKARPRAADESVVVPQCGQARRSEAAGPARRLRANARNAADDRHGLPIIASGTSGQTVNGKQQGEKQPAVILAKDVFHPLSMGAQRLGDKNMFGPYVMTIDEVRFSKVARYRSNYTPIKRFEPDQDTIALYHFDEGKGLVLKDASDNHHDATIESGKWVISK